MGFEVLDTAGRLKVTDASTGPTAQFRGLHLRTHPDSDVATSKLLLTHADEVVFDDGTRIADINNIVFDLAASGLGGLDTGAEGASRWYEAYLVAKNDGTVGGVLHLAKNFSVDTLFTTARNASRALRLLTGTATDKLAQGIQFATSAPFHYLDVELIRAGAVSGQIWFSLQASSGGDADGTPLATTDKINAGIIITSNQIIRLIFRTPYSETLSTQYHLVLEGNYSKSDTVNIAWRGVAAGGYTSGVAREYNGTTWANASGVGDFYFQAAVVVNDAAVTLPDGYTKQCKIGHGYNNASSNFDHFVQVGHHVGLLINNVGASATTSALLFDISPFVPPIPVSVRVAASSGTAAQSIRIMELPDGYGSTSFASASPITLTVADQVYDGGLLNTEYQGLYAFNNAGANIFNMYVTGFVW